MPSDPTPERQQHREVPAQHRAGEHLANERTFLAWVRTNIAIVSLGFVLARFNLLLRENGTSTPHLGTRTHSLGVGMIGFGALLTLLAAWRYDAVNRQIESGRVKTDRALVWSVTIAVALLAFALAAYTIASD